MNIRRFTVKLIFLIQMNSLPPSSSSVQVLVHNVVHPPSSHVSLACVGTMASEGRIHLVLIHSPEEPMTLNASYHGVFE